MEWKQKTLMNELTRGKELAKELRNHLGGGISGTSSSETQKYLVKKLLSSYDKALSLLNWDDNNSNNVNNCAANTNTNKVEEVLAHRSFQKQQHHRGISKRKKKLSYPTWTKQVRSWSEPSRHDANTDGYSWRKYGQKLILGATFPREYYKCSHHYTQGCPATKQVQRSDEDPTIFNVKYCRRHNCVQVSRAHVKTSSITMDRHQENPDLTSKETVHRHMDVMEDIFKSHPLPSPLITPKYVEENIFGDCINIEYFPISSSQINNGQFSDIDIADTISTSPLGYSSIEDVHLRHHKVDLGENYQFIDSVEPLSLWHGG